MTFYYGIYPAIIEEYLGGDSRMVMVNVPGLTDGMTHAEAVLSVPVGDRPELTEQRILAADKCWVQFQGGDPRYPVVTGYRTPETGSQEGWRRWAHTNIETAADEESNHTAATYTITATDSITFTVGGSSFQLTSSGFALVGAVTQTGGDITSDGISVQSHTHLENGQGSQTAKPTA